MQLLGKGYVQFKSDKTTCPPKEAAAITTHQVYPRAFTWIFLEFVLLYYKGDEWAHAQLICTKFAHVVSSLWLEGSVAGKTHLADLRQGHGDAVELVFAGAGNQGLLWGAEAHAEDILFIRLTWLIAL